MLTYGERLRAIEAAKDLTPMQTLILMVLNNFAGSDGECFPTPALIAAKSHCSERTVERFLSQLHQAGILTRHARFDDCGRRRRGSRLVIAWQRLNDLAKQSRQRIEPASPLFDACDSQAYDRSEPPILDRHHVGKLPTTCRDKTDTVSVSPLHPPISGKIQEKEKEHTSEPPATPNRRPEPSGRECVLLVNRFFEALRGDCPTVRPPSPRETALAARVIARLGFDAAFVEIRRIVETVRRSFPDLQHFTATARYWDAAIAARRKAERRQQTEHDRQAKAQAESAQARQSATDHQAARRIWSERFDLLDAGTQQRWIAAAETKSAAIRGTKFARLHAVDLFRESHQEAAA